MKIKRIIISLLILSLSSCALAVAAGSAAGAALYFRGQLKASRNATLDQAWHASSLAFQVLDLELESKERDGLYAEFIGRRSDERKVVVSLKKLEEDVVQIGIRVGIIGDEEQSRIILSQIERRLYDDPQQIRTGAGGQVPQLPDVGLDIHNKTQ
jgi:hypothetical protein